MLCHDDGLTPVDMTIANYRIPDDIGRDVIDAIKREFRAALMPYKNGHGELPFAVFHFIGNNNRDWEQSDLAVKHLYRYYRSRDFDDEGAYNEARKMAGKIFRHVLAEDPNTRFMTVEKRVFSDGLSRSFYTIIRDGNAQ